MSQKRVRTWWRLLCAALMLTPIVVPITADAQSVYVHKRKEKIIEALLKGGPFAEGSFYACVNSNYQRGLTVEQVIVVCSVSMENDMLDGYGPQDTINDVLDGTGVDAFDPSQVQGACGVGDSTLSQNIGGREPVDSRPTTHLYPRDQKGVPNADGLPLLQVNGKGYPVLDSNRNPIPLYGSYSWGGKGTNATDADGKVVGEYQGLSREESEKRKREAIEKLKVAKKKFDNGEISYSELDAAEKEAEADPNIKPKNVSLTADNSMCQTALSMAREALRECNRTGWKAAQCQVLAARMNRCPDPTLIYVDPDGGYACGAKMDAKAVIEAWQAGCKSVTLPGPDGDPCGPLKILNDRGQVAWSDARNLCTNEIAYIGDPEAAGCIATIKVDKSMSPDINAIVLFALSHFGGPIVVLPIKNPPPPGVGPEPMPGPK